MITRKKLIRKSHRYLGLFLGIQFLFWTVSGLYFSWTNIDEIHGDHFKKQDIQNEYHKNLIHLDSLKIKEGISQIELRNIDKKPFYWINNKYLINAYNAKLKNGVNKEEAIKIAQKHLSKNLVIESIELLTETDKHNEYRSKQLPAYKIAYIHKDRITVYISKDDGKFQKLRHRSWRWFDFLWMTHTMDYDTRDNFNTTILRVFSLLGLITVLSGFLLWISSSKRLKKN